MQTENGVQSVTVKVGLLDSSELFRLTLKVGMVQTATDSAVYATMEEPEVAIVPKCNTKVDSARLLANTADFMTVDKWVGNLGFNGAKTVLAL